jgi:hypothetical protein
MNVGTDDQMQERTRLRIGELQQRTLEITERRQQLALQEMTGGSSLEEVRRANERAEQALVNAASARTHATIACLRSADAHEAAAARHEALAAAGFGDVEEHRRQAQRHREMSAADRLVAGEV